jgi:pimeloyl-ACP methyl ester carboxylesterase
MRRDVTFRSEGAGLEGWLYEPRPAPPWPLVVMAHGFSATRGIVADRYSEVLQAARLAVLLYDHRGFGHSGGEPRCQINPWMQARGFRDAMTYGSRLDRVDASRVALWGDSFSGGVALAVAAIDRRVKALVVQVPALGAEFAPSDPTGSLFHALEQTLLSGSVEGPAASIQGPMRVVSDDQICRPSALKPLTAYRWFSEYGKRPDSGWVNTITRALPATPVAWHAGLCPNYVSCPTLFVVASEDEMPGSSPVVAGRAFDDLAGPKQWLDIAGGHFGLLYFPSDEFERAACAEARFLTGALLTGNSPELLSQP